MVFKNKQHDHKKKELNEAFFLFCIKKKCKSKTYWILSAKIKLPSDIVLLLNFVWDGFKKYFTMIDHFTNYEWVILLNDKKSETISTALKNTSSRTIFLIEIRQINEDSLKTMSWKILWIERNCKNLWSIL